MTVRNYEGFYLVFLRYHIRTVALPGYSSLSEAHKSEVRRCIANAAAISAREGRYEDYRSGFRTGSNSAVTTSSHPPDPISLLREVLLSNSTTNAGGHMTAAQIRRQQLVVHLRQRLHTLQNLNVLSGFSGLSDLLVSRMNNGVSSSASSTLNETQCEICSRVGDEETMLLCGDGNKGRARRGCNKGFHMHCLVPVLEVVPGDDWFCPECTESMDTSGVEIMETLPEEDVIASKFEKAEAEGRFIEID